MTERSLITDRLILTPVTTADLDDLLALWSDTAFTRHIMGRALGAEEVWFRLLRTLLDELNTPISQCGSCAGSMRDVWERCGHPPRAGQSRD